MRRLLYLLCLHSGRNISPERREYHAGQPSYSDMTWFEFAASAGSTLGIFCLVAAAADASLSGEDVDAIKKAYFPWVQGLHILLDYFIDREEDRLCGDLNFCFYYPDERLMIDRLITFLRQSRRSVYHLPHKKFHTLICNGLPSIYCADTKLDKHKEMRFAARKILLAGGSSTVLFFVFLWVYRRISLLSFP
ncbi:MAG TPA: DUF2600 family protein [Syntrophorhabdaceae bacterium]|nr:DUF2600 family protein [Syntrophorhabdaceae bacterium]